MKQIKTLFILMLALASIVSCNKTDDTQVTLYSDAAITAFSLVDFDNTFQIDQTESRYTIHINSAKDSTVIARHIFNVDSLVAGSDAAKLLLNISTLNNGVAIIRDTTTFEQWLYVSSTDSIDVTSPRLLRIWSSDGTGYADYVLEVRVHQEDGDILRWLQTDSSWTPADVTLPDGIKQLLGNSSTEEYALSTTNQLMVKRQGATDFVPDNIDADDAGKLPTDVMAMTCYTVDTGKDLVDYLILAGQWKEETTATDGSINTVWHSAVWRKIIDYGKDVEQAQWTYMERSKDLYALPPMSSLSLIYYDGSILAVGRAMDDNSYSILQSRDGGITWKTSSLYQLPDGFNHAATQVKAETDSDNYIWLHCEGTGQVWRGRLNRLGWQ